MRAALAEAVIALTIGCGHATTHFPDSGHPDSGPDAGPDSGDGGCAGSFVGFARDACFSGNNASRTAAVIASGCSANIYLDDIFYCSGALSGPADVFAGDCLCQACSAPSIPGTIHCTNDAGVVCPIQICTGACP